MEEKHVSQISSLPSFSHPLSLSHSNSILLTKNKKDISHIDINHKTICISIFLSYSAFSFDEKDFVISLMNLFHLFKDIGIMRLSSKVTSSSNKSLKQYDIELLIKKVRSKGKILNSQEFLNLLVLFSEKMRHSIFKSNPKEAMNDIIKTYFLPFYKKLIEPNSLIKEGSVFSFHRILEEKIKLINFDSNIIDIFNSIHQVLIMIYKSYFILENSNSNQVNETIRKSLDDLIVFAKEFDIYPYLIEINKTVILYHLILELPAYEITKSNRYNGEVFDINNNQGKVLTLSKFTMLLFHLALISFDKVKQALSPEQLENCTNAEVLLLFLDKLQRGRGMEFLNKRVNKPITKGFSLIPPIDVIEKLDTVLITTHQIDENDKRNSKTQINIVSDDNKMNFSVTRNENQEVINKNNNNQNVDSQNRLNFSLKFNHSVNYQQYLTFSNSKVVNLYHRNIEKLNNIFETYCSVGDKTKNHTLAITGYLVFLRHFTIISIEDNNYNNNSKRPPSSIKAKQLSQDLSLNNNINNINKSLKQSKSLSLFKPKFTEIDATLIFNQVCRKYSTKEKICMMNFGMFLFSFEKLAEKKYPLAKDNTSAIEQFFLEYIENKFDNKISKINNETGTRKEEILKVHTYIKGSKIYQIINELQDTLYGIYINYCDPNELLSFNQFTLLYKDFGIFPDTVTLIQMKNIFYSLAELLKQEIMQNIQKEMKQNNILFTPKNLQQFNPILEVDKINFEIYCEALGITSLYMKSNKTNITDIDKVFILLQKMSLNSALETILKNSVKGINSTKEFNLSIEALKRKYILNINNIKGYYSDDSENLKNLLNSPTSFEDILNS